MDQIAADAGTVALAVVVASAASTVLADKVADNMGLTVVERNYYWAAESMD